MTELTGLPTLEDIERGIDSHDSWCDKYGDHLDCCGPGYTCTCTVGYVIGTLIQQGWLKVDTDELNGSQTVFA